VWAACKEWGPDVGEEPKWAAGQSWHVGCRMLTKLENENRSECLQCWTEEVVVNYSLHLFIVDTLYYKFVVSINISKMELA